MSAAVDIAEKNKSSAMYAGRPHVLLERGWIAFKSSTVFAVLKRAEIVFIFSSDLTNI